MVAPMRVSRIDDDVIAWYLDEEYVSSSVDGMLCASFPVASMDGQLQLHNLDTDGKDFCRKCLSNALVSAHLITKSPASHPDLLLNTSNYNWSCKFEDALVFVCADHGSTGLKHGGLVELEPREYGLWDGTTDYMNYLVPDGQHGINNMNPRRSFKYMDLSDPENPKHIPILGDLWVMPGAEDVGAENPNNPEWDNITADWSMPRYLPFYGNQAKLKLHEAGDLPKEEFETPNYVRASCAYFDVLDFRLFDCSREDNNPPLETLQSYEDANITYLSYTAGAQIKLNNDEDVPDLLLEDYHLVSRFVML